MRKPTTFYITKEHADRIERLVDDGIFDSTSALIEYAMRRYIEKRESDRLVYFRRVGPLTKVSGRFNSHVLESMRGLLDASDIADYAIEDYMRFLDAHPVKGTVKAF